MESINQRLRPKEYFAAYREKNREKLRERMRTYRENNREKLMLWHRAWRKKNPERARKIEKKQRLWKHYRMTVDEYDAMLRRQRGVCAVCKEKKGKLFIDHCHTTGKVRGILCQRCNIAIGMMRENVGIWLSIKNYLWTPECSPENIMAMHDRKAA